MTDQRTVRALDPVTFEVLKNAFGTSVDLMSEQILRTCHSFVIYARDFSCSLITSESELREAVLLLTDSPGMATARDTLAGYADAAKAELALLPDSSSMQALSSLVRFVVARTR